MQEDKAINDLLRPVKLEGEAAEKFLLEYLNHIDSDMKETRKKHEKHLLTLEEVKEMFEGELDD